MKYLLFVVILFSSISYAETEFPSLKFKVDKYKLKNGLTVLIYEDHSSPLVSLHHWFKVGSKDEQVGLTGLAHFFEHMMFRGTKKYSGADFDRLIKSNGGSNNAFTSRDYTGYYVDVPSGTLELMLDIESDRMTNLIFSDEIAQKERKVVKEERRMRVENSPMGVLYEALYKTLYKVNNYRWPIIGSMKDLDSATIKDLKAFYKTFYAPNNCVLVIAGDVDVAKTKKWIEKYYSKIPSQEIKRPVFKREPEQKGERRVVIKKSVQSPKMMVAFKGPKANEKEAYALDLLASILGGDESSRLYKRLVRRDQAVSKVYAYSHSQKHDGVFNVFASVNKGSSELKVERSIFGEIYKFRKNKVTEKELKSAKNNLLKSYVGTLKTVSGKANILALNETLFDDYSVFFKDIEMYRSVTADDIYNVANKYLTPQKRSVLKVLPKSKAN